MHILMRATLLSLLLWQGGALNINAVAEGDNPRSYRSDMKTLQSDITVLLLGSSVDRYALIYFCQSVDGGLFYNDAKFTTPLATANPVSICSIPQRNVKIAYMFIPGSGPPPYWGCGSSSPFLCGNHTAAGDMQHATTEDIVDIDARDLATRALGTIAPTFVVVESSLWDLSRWWINAGQPPMDTYTAPEHEIERWCKQEAPQLVGRARRVFASSRVLFRTPPVVIKSNGGQTPEALERMTECIRTQMREDELFDYHQLVDDLMREAPTLRRSAESVFLFDGRHPGKCAGIKYFHALLSEFGLGERAFRTTECLSMY